MSEHIFTIGMVTIDCTDPRSLADFWSKATGAPIVMDNEYFVIVGSTPALGFQRSADPTPGKNRIHIDGNGGDRAAQVARLVALGATEGPSHEFPGFAWTVLTDPAGNEFCVGDPRD